MVPTPSVTQLSPRHPKVSRTGCFTKTQGGAAQPSSSSHTPAEPVEPKEERRAYRQAVLLPPSVG